LKKSFKIGAFIGILVVVFGIFNSFRNIDKDYDAVLLAKGFSEMEKISVHFSGVRDFNIVSSFVSGKITIKDKTYKVILDEDDIINKYEGITIDTSSNLESEHEIIGEIYLSKNLKELYCYFKEDGSFIVAPVNDVEDAKSFFYDRGIK
jgi:hypothetical protein